MVIRQADVNAMETMKRMVADFAKSIDDATFEWDYVSDDYGYPQAIGFTFVGRNGRQYREVFYPTMSHNIYESFVKIVIDLKSWLKRNSESFEGYCKCDIEMTKEAAKRALNKKFGLPLTIKKVIFNDPATIVFWSDNTKTVVKAQDLDDFDPEKGMAMAIAKKFLGTNESGSNYYDEIKKWVELYYEKAEVYKNALQALKEAIVMATNNLPITKKMGLE